MVYPYLIAVYKLLIEMLFMVNSIWEKNVMNVVLTNVFLYFVHVCMCVVQIINLIFSVFSEKIKNFQSFQNFKLFIFEKFEKTKKIS